MHNIYFVKTSGLEDGKESIVHETKESIVHETCIELIDRMFQCAVFLTNNQGKAEKFLASNVWELNYSLSKFLYGPTLIREIFNDDNFKNVMAKVKEGAEQNQLYAMYQETPLITKKEMKKKRHTRELEILPDIISNWVQNIDIHTFANFVVRLMCLFVEQHIIDCDGNTRWKSKSGSQQLSKSAKIRLQQLFEKKNSNVSERQDIVKHLFTDTDDKWFSALVGLDRILDV